VSYIYIILYIQICMQICLTCWCFKNIFDELIKSTAEKKTFIEISVEKCCTTFSLSEKEFFSRNVKRVPVIFGITEFRCNNFTEKLSAVRLAPAQPCHYSFFYVLHSAFALCSILSCTLFYARSRSYVVLCILPLKFYYC